MLLLQDAEESLEDEYDTVPEASRIENSPSSDTHSKPYESNDKVPLLPTLAFTPAFTASPDPGTHSDRDRDRSSTVTVGRSPTPDFQSSSQTLRKRKRRSSLDSNAAQNRELINSNLRDTHILPKGLTRNRKPSRKSSSFFINKY